MGDETVNIPGQTKASLLEPPSECLLSKSGTAQMADGGCCNTTVIERYYSQGLLQKVPAT